jgi:hypothetical protein
MSLHSPAWLPLLYHNLSLLPAGGLPAVRPDSAAQRSLCCGEPAAPDLPDPCGGRQPAHPPHSAHPPQPARPPHPAQKVCVRGSHGAAGRPLASRPLRQQDSSGQLLYKVMWKPHILISTISVADPDPGSGALLTPGSGMGKKSRSGSGMNILDHISESLETMFWVKNYIISLMRIRIRIRESF